MGNINRLPRGLLAYLDSQTQGENPASLGSVVAPVLSLEPFYRANTAYQLRYKADTNITVAGQYVELQVPNDQVWHLHSFGANVLNNTGFPCLYAVSLFLAQSGDNYIEHLPLSDTIQYPNVLPSEVRRLAYRGDSPIVLIGGMRIGVTIDVATLPGPALVVTVRALVNVLQA